MPAPTINEDLTKLAREFIEAARAKLHDRLKDLDADTMIERLFGGLAAVVAAFLMIFPLGKNKDGYIGALLATAMRHLAKRTVPRG